MRNNMSLDKHSINPFPPSPDYVIITVIPDHQTILCNGIIISSPIAEVHKKILTDKE